MVKILLLISCYLSSLWIVLVLNQKEGVELPDKAIDARDHAQHHVRVLKGRRDVLRDVLHVDILGGQRQKLALTVDNAEQAAHHELHELLDDILSTVRILFSHDNRQTRQILLHDGFDLIQEQK